MLQELGDIVLFGLEEREDRWQRSLEVLQSAGVTEVTRFANKKKADKWRGATEDFLKVLRLMPGNIVFFEDDFELTDDWKDVLQKAWKDLPEKWDLLYLGANLTKSPKIITNNLVKIRGAWCFHAVVINKEFVKYALRTFDPNRKIVFDEWLRMESCKRNFYMTYPMISFQRKSFSDYEDKEVFYNIFNNKYYTRL